MPGNFTISKVPSLNAVPPKARKIFLLASTSPELRCQCPIVTPASLGGNGCAQADAVAKPVMSHSAGMSVLTIASYIGVLVRTRSGMLHCPPHQTTWLCRVMNYG